MHDDRKANKPPVSPDDEQLARLIADAAAGDPDHAAWSDERFITWLTDRHGENALARAGRQLLTRAYCRKLGVQLLEGAPTVVEAPSYERGTYVPLTDLISLISGGVIGEAGHIEVPAACAALAWVACAATTELICFAPFISVGDILIVSRATPVTTPAATVRRVDGRPAVATDDGHGEFIGTLVALWPRAT